METGFVLYRGKACCRIFFAGLKTAPAKDSESRNRELGHDAEIIKCILCVLIEVYHNGEWIFFWECWLFFCNLEYICEYCVYRYQNYNLK